MLLNPQHIAELRYLSTRGSLWRFVPPGKDSTVDGYAADGLVTWKDGTGWSITDRGRKVVGAERPCPHCGGTGLLLPPPLSSRR
jgi:hypothetical protein